MPAQSRVRRSPGAACTFPERRRAEGASHAGPVCSPGFSLLPGVNQTVLSGLRKPRQRLTSAAGDPVAGGWPPAVSRAAAASRLQAPWVGRGGPGVGGWAGGPSVGLSLPLAFLSHRWLKLLLLRLVIL